jgi:hypothetical protein
MSIHQKENGLIEAKATVTSTALSNLNDAVREAHTMIETLVAHVAPHMPRHMFDPEDQDGTVKKEAAPSRVSDYDHMSSEVVNGINRMTNEVDRLTLRIQYLKNNLVV